MKIPFIIVCILLSTNILVAQCSKVMPNWIIGTWTIENNISVSYEQWSNKGDTLYMGRTFGLYGNDTIKFDEMFIKCIDDKPIYFMYGSKQNAKVFAGYQVTPDSDQNILIFKNNEIDFPNEFCYTKVNDTTIMVWFKSNNLDDACIDFKMVKKLE